MSKLGQLEGLKVWMESNEVFFDTPRNDTVATHIDDAYAEYEDFCVRHEASTFPRDLFRSQLRKLGFVLGAQGILGLEVIGAECKCAFMPDAPMDPTEVETYLCYKCGNTLEVGVAEPDSICWHCRYDEMEAEDA